MLAFKAEMKKIKNFWQPDIWPVKGKDCNWQKNTDTAQMKIWKVLQRDSLPFEVFGSKLTEFVAEQMKRC